MSSLEAYLRQLSPDGLRIHLWARQGGGFQANVSEPGNGAWTVVHDDDAVDAVREALRQRVAGVSGRIVEASDGYTDAPRSEAEQQIDIEDAIAAAPAAVDDFEGLLG